MTRLVFVFAALLGMALSGPVDPEPRNEEWWMDRHAQYVSNTNTNGQSINVLFYGDSITEGWGGAGAEVFNQYYAPLGTANYGIGGDQTQHLLWRISNGEVEGLAPKLCVLKIGTNNLGYEDRDIANGVITVVNLLRLKLPNMRILLLGILPRNDANLTARVDNINSMIDDLDDGYWVKFFNMRDTFYMGDGQFNLPLYTDDLLHLSTEGYKAWQQVMDPIFQEMLSS
jgi:lysophospholipase L1-like esterase